MSCNEAVKLYKNVIIRYWLEKIKYNIGVTIFIGIYVDKLEDYVEETSCVGLNLSSIFIISGYANDIVLMMKSYCDVNKQLKIVIGLWKLIKQYDN